MTNPSVSMTSRRSLTSRAARGRSIVNTREKLIPLQAMLGSRKSLSRQIHQLYIYLRLSIFRTIDVHAAAVTGSKIGRRRQQPPLGREKPLLRLHLLTTNEWERVRHEAPGGLLHACQLQLRMVWRHTTEEVV